MTKRLDKRQRALVAAAHNAQRAAIASNVTRAGELTEAKRLSPRLNAAYASDCMYRVKPVKMVALRNGGGTIGGRIRVMHNMKSVAPSKGPQERTVFDRSRCAYAGVDPVPGLELPTPKADR